VVEGFFPGWQAKSSLRLPLTTPPPPPRKLPLPPPLATSLIVDEATPSRPGREEEGKKSGGSGSSSSREWVEKIRSLAGKPEVLEVLQEAIKTVGSGELREEFFKVRRMVAHKR